MEIAGPVVEQAAWDRLTGDRPTHGKPVGRWLAAAESTPIAGIEIILRPDGKHFLSWFGSPGPAGPRLIALAADVVPHPLYANCDQADHAQHAMLRESGFEIVMTEDVFEVEFSTAIAALQRAWAPSGHTIASAADVPRDELFTLDNRLRQLVPGLDGWIGDREAFEAELNDAPPFDPGSYLVAHDHVSGELTGLVRFWRNPSAPRLGMVAVLPSHRFTTIGPALLKAALLVASGWGSPHFVTETAVTNRHVHRRLLSIGARRISAFDVLRHESR